MTQIHVGVQAIVTAHRKPALILLGKRKGIYGDGQWALPGGHLEFGESFEAAIKRELMEETGISAGAVQYFTSVNTAYIREGAGSHYVQIGMQVLDYQGEPSNQEPDRCAEVRWFDLDSPLPTPLFAPSRPFLELMQRYRQSPELLTAASRLSIYMHCINFSENVDKYVSYDLLADVPVLIIRFGRRNEVRSRQIRVHAPSKLIQCLEFLRKDIAKRLAHNYRLYDVRGSLGVDLVHSVFPPGTIAFRSIGMEGAFLDGRELPPHETSEQRASATIRMSIDHAHGQPTLFDLTPESL